MSDALVLVGYGLVVGFSLGLTSGVWAMWSRMETLMQTTGTFKEIHDNTSRKPTKAKGGKKR